MKIRSGFVSNSSSSSFVLYGEYFEAKWNDVEESYKNLLKSLDLDPDELEIDEHYKWETNERLSTILMNKGYDVELAECGIYYGVIVYPEGPTDEVIKALRLAKKRAKKLKLEDCMELVHCST